MIHYILQTIAFQLFFLIIYDVFLKKETFFNWNRAYLLVSALISVALPFIKIEQFKDIVPQEFIIALPEVVVGSLTQEQTSLILGSGIQDDSGVFSWQLLLYLGALIALGLFVFKLVRIALLIYKNPKRWQGDLMIVQLINSNAAFSFFYYVFLGEHIKQEDKDTILRHESIHVQQKHSLDLLVFEMLRILFWFNPLVYMYQNRITTLHEYIADAKALKTQDKQGYYENLLSQVFETQNVSFINSFFKQSLIKKRIIMISKTKSKQILKLKYILFVPLVFGMLVYTSYAQEKPLDGKAIDLSQYVYTMQKDEGHTMSITIQDGHNKYEAFLKANPDYVSWAEHTADKVQYSVHHRDEKVPENMEKSAVNFPDGSSYVMYINWPKNIDTQSSYSDILTNINMLKESIAAKGDMTEEEEKALKTLMMLVTKDGLNEPFFQDVVELAEIPFGVIENVPLFPGCENLSTNAERKACMSDRISKHVQTNFNTDMAKDLGLVGRQRINVIFKIDSDGNIVGIRSRASHLKLQEEAERVIGTLPKMIPGNHDGQKVIVPYSLPIIFEVSNSPSGSENKDDMNEVTVPEDTKVKKEGPQKRSELPYSIVEIAPVYPGCETMSTNSERRKCTSEKISEFVLSEFNKDLAGELGLKRKQRINVIFKINKNGNIEKIRSRAAHPKLEKEAKRVISLLPKMTPGSHDGKNVIVPYSLPIIFELAPSKN